MSSPTCADDIALLGCKCHELQSLLDIVQYSIGRDLVTINPANRLECPKVKIDNNEITEVRKAKHLGLIRKAKKNYTLKTVSKLEDKQHMPSWALVSMLNEVCLP